MVHIYNLKERKIDTNLNSIEPMSKIVVYSMKNVLDILDQIDYRTVKSVRFDGETLWIPAN